MKPKILIFDIETCQMEGRFWSPATDYIRHSRVTKHRSVIAWAAKWYGAPASEIMYMDQRAARDIRDDKRILEVLYRLLDEADIVITKNGKRFDQKVVFGRFAINNINDRKPPSPFKHEDVEELFRRHFSLPYYNMDYLAETFCKKYRKLKHKKFPGEDLWDACEAGDIEAWREMERYNKNDVLVTEELRNIISPWGTPININLFHEEAIYRCQCGGSDFQKRGFAVSSSGRFQKYQCKSCGAWHQSKGATNNLMSEKKRLSLKSPK